VDELCENYSQGMKQRVVFASALVHDPRVLVVDEPLVGLDPRSARIVKDLFVAQARSGCAVLMSTHLLVIAEELADRIGIVDHGRGPAPGTPRPVPGAGPAAGPPRGLVLETAGSPGPAANWVPEFAGGAPAGGAPPMSLPTPDPPRLSPAPAPADQTARALRQ